MGRLLLIRHGETVANRNRIIQGPRIDAPLSDLGRRQADRLGDALAREPLHAVFTSPLVRARATAEAVVSRHAAARAGLHLPLQVVPELCEFDYGHFAGRTYEETRDEMDQVLDAWRLGFVSEAMPGGESAILAQHRIRHFVERVAEEARSSTVAVVAHGRINRILAATLTGAGLQRLEEFPQSNASISEFAVEPDRVDVVRLNDTRHLDLGSDSFS